MPDSFSTETQGVNLGRDLVFVGWMAAAIVVLDQASKWLAELAPSWPVVDAARSGGELFSGANPDMIWATPIALIASAALVLLAFGLHHSERLHWQVVAIVGAGAVGTVIDLVAFGSMRTWFVVGPTRWSLSSLSLIAAVPFLAGATVSLLRNPVTFGDAVDTAGPTTSIAARRSTSMHDAV